VPSAESKKHLESCAGRTQVELGAGRERVKKFFVRVNECWPNACESDMDEKFNATESLSYNMGVDANSNDDETT